MGRGRGRIDMENGQNRFISTTATAAAAEGETFGPAYSQLSGFQRVIIA